MIFGKALIPPPTCLNMDIDAMFENKYSIHKALISLAIALLLIVYPLVSFVASLHFSSNAVTGEAEIIAYQPQICGKAGGRREIREYYDIRYLNFEKRLLLKSRIVTSK